MLFCIKQKTAYEMRISDWSSDVCSSDLDRSDAIRRNLVTQRHEQEVAARAALGLDRVDRGDASQCGTDRHRCKKLDTTARPHAAGERHGRQQAMPVAARMAVRADHRLARGRPGERRVGHKVVRTCGSRGMQYT